MWWEEAVVRVMMRGEAMKQGRYGCDEKRRILCRHNERKAKKGGKERLVYMICVWYDLCLIF